MIRRAHNPSEWPSRVNSPAKALIRGDQRHRDVGAHHDIITMNDGRRAGHRSALVRRNHRAITAPRRTGTYYIVYICHRTLRGSGCLAISVCG